MTTATYAPLSIFRQTDNALIAEFAKHHGVFQEIEFTKLKQSQVEPLYEALQALDEQKRDAIEKELRQISALATKRHIQQLFAGLQSAGHDLPEFDKKKGYHDKAMWAWLHHKDVCQKTLFFSFEDAQKRYWHKYPYGIDGELSFEQADVERLDNAICQYFRARDGRAKHSRIEHHHSQGKEYLIAYPLPIILMKFLNGQKQGNLTAVPTARHLKSSLFLNATGMRWIFT